MQERAGWTRRLTGRKGLLVLLVPVLTAAALALGDPGWPLALVLAAQAILLWWGNAGERTSRPAAPETQSLAAADRGVVQARLAATDSTQQTAALAIRLDESPRLTGLYGPAFLAVLDDALAERLGGALREHDAFCRLDGGGFGVALLPQRRLDIGHVLSVAQRIQHRLSQPFSHEGNTVWPSVSVGFCLSARAAALNGIDMLQAAERAAEKALQSGPAGLNSYSIVDFPAALAGDRIEALRHALDTGEIRAHFQPQIRTDNGHVSGLEALARWHHPQRGIIAPGDFLPQIEAAGLSQKLADRMLRDALDTLAALDREGLSVPTVSINLSADELRNPQLADEIIWALDRADLAPGRLTVEILETVVAGGQDDAAVHTIARLAGLGCGIDLDDFGTGHASIANIRRFAVGRIKIDRSFVTRLHEDPDQERMVAAILSMAQQLGLATLAEGVECAGEQIRLAQMGCDHLQGFAIARPMPAPDLPGWLRAHDAALARGEPWCEDPAAARAANAGDG
ncbi:MAG: EAL domain-containing protein [Rhodobacteraceae bacterium]|nr:EAL domain-containing protein [Paracoccaceae bacterium]